MIIMYGMMIHLLIINYYLRRIYLLHYNRWFIITSCKTTNVGGNISGTLYGTGLSHSGGDTGTNVSNKSREYGLLQFQLTLPIPYYHVNIIQI